MIRKAEEQDIPFLLDIYNEAILNGTATFDLEPKTLEDRKQWFYDHIETHPLLVCEKYEKAIAYASLSTYREKKAYDGSVELSIYIHKDYRGIGIGKQLMEAILNLAKEIDGIHTIISIITAGNEVSDRLHEKFGFTYCGKIKEAGYKFGQYCDINVYQIMV
ncbi:GNAT family N-acetyltransferase [Clostridium kluyveri]|uniref:Predicted acetyltransferase n=2 Tax=Clostridium kluyveri TaxID=1534 RepID=A5MZL4_CLOK5|nr:GNAT family N-acetyltransferase [Clostridium kluyveri]EDK34310.1 Predicted acetyltransferase [Clostridium kluyveri DSM 555]BAH07071.1 hypothetical protein CKR_2020 [Clostridium kluyveri NBRC 12016]